MLSRPLKQTWWHSIVITILFWGGRGAANIKSQEFLHRIVGVDRGDGGGLGWDGAILVQCWQDSRSNRMEEVIPGQNIVSALDSMGVTPWWAEWRVWTTLRRSDGGITIRFL